LREQRWFTKSGLIQRETENEVDRTGKCAYLALNEESGEAEIFPIGCHMKLKIYTQICQIPNTQTPSNAVAIMYITLKDNLMYDYYGKDGRLHQYDQDSLHFCKTCPTVPKCLDLSKSENGHFPESCGDRLIIKETKRNLDKRNEFRSPINDKLLEWYLRLLNESKPNDNMFGSDQLFGKYSCL